MDNSCISIVARIIKNFFLILRTKGIVALILAIKSYIQIVIYKKFLPSSFIKKKIFNYKMYLDPKDEGISRTLLLFGKRELDHKIILEKVLKKSMNIFDIGANIGYYVLMESELICNKGKILAIEPVKKNMQLLEKNLKLNNNKITETAILAADSKKDVKKQGGSSNFLSTSHSNIGRLISQKIVNTTFAKFKKKIGSKTNILVTRTQHIEEIIENNFVPDFIRMDIEGSEADILYDLASLKLKKNPIICFETHTSQYKSYLEKKNLSKMEKALKKMFKKGYKVDFVSSSSERGSNKLEKLGYEPLYDNIKTDDVTRKIYKNLKEKDAITLICHQGGLRTILMVYNK